MYFTSNTCINNNSNHSCNNSNSLCANNSAPGSATNKMLILGRDDYKTSL